MAGKPSGMLSKLADFGHGDTTSAHYDAWAEQYDADLLGEFGYSGHVIAAEAMAEACQDRRAALIDIGCGTGLVGVELAKHGFQTIDGIDIAPEMLAKSRERGIYRGLFQGDLNATTSIADAAYDAAVCAGSFAPGHLAPLALREIIRMVRPGGVIVVFMNGAPFVADDYAGFITRLADEGLWRVGRIEAMNYMSALDRPGRLIVAERC